MSILIHPKNDIVDQESRPKVSAQDLIWVEAGDKDPRAVLRASILIAGCPMHLYAYEVVESEDGGMLEATDAYFSEEVEAIESDFVRDRASTTVINERTYVLCAYPYGR